MMSEDQGLRFCRTVEDPLLADGSSLRRNIKDWKPLGVLQMEGMQDSIGDIQ